MKKIKLTGTDVTQSLIGSGLYCLIADDVFGQPFEWYTWPVSFAIFLVVSVAFNTFWERKK